MSDITSKLDELDEMLRKADEHTQHDDGDVCCYCNRPMGVRDDLDPVPYCWLCGTDKYETVRAAYPDISNAIRTLTRERNEARAGESAMRAKASKPYYAPDEESSKGNDYCRLCDAQYRYNGTVTHEADCPLAEPSPGAPLLAELERAKARVAELEAEVKRLQPVGCTDVHCFDNGPGWECDEHKLECDHCPHVETFESEAEKDMARRDGDWCEGHNNDLFCSADCRADAYDPGVKFED